MSNMIENEQRLTFREAPAADLPKKVCVGYVSQVLPGKVSSTGKYVVQPIQLDGLGGGKSLRDNLLYRPEWFSPGFDPLTIKDEIEDDAEAERVLKVYYRNINGRGAISKLRGLAGSAERFEILAHRLLSQDEVTIENVTSILTEFFEENANDQVKVGYILKQQSTRTDDINPETGKNIWIKENRYEVDSYFDVTDEALKRLAKAAERSNGHMQMTYDFEPF